MTTQRLSLPQLNRAAIDGADKMQEYARSVDALRQSFESMHLPSDRCIDHCDRLALAIGKCYDAFLDLASATLKEISRIRKEKPPSADGGD